MELNMEGGNIIHFESIDTNGPPGQDNPERSFLFLIPAKKHKISCSILGSIASNMFTPLSHKKTLYLF
jgi:hypothetical protein